jgi:hypothetical protein
MLLPNNMAGLPLISSSTLNAYSEKLTYIKESRTVVYTEETEEVDTITKVENIIYGTALDLKPRELQLKPLEMQSLYWKGFIIPIQYVANIELNNYIKYQGKTFKIINELVGSNFRIYHCCEHKNV